MKRIHLGNERKKSILFERHEGFLIISCMETKGRSVNVVYKTMFTGKIANKLRLFLSGASNGFFEKKILIIRSHDKILSVYLVENEKAVKFVKLEVFGSMNLAEFLDVEYQTK